MSDLVGNPEDRFSHNKAHLTFVKFFIHSPMENLKKKDNLLRRSEKEDELIVQLTIK